MRKNWPMPSLQDLVLRRVAVILWNRPDILASFEKPLTVLSTIESPIFDEWAEEWRSAAQRKVLEKMSKILPQLIRRQMLLILDPVCLLIRNWLMFHVEYLSLPLNVPILEYLCWTTLGTIDYRKTAVGLLRCEKLDIVSRYKLSCLYCLDEEVAEFWKELSKEIKMTFYKNDICKFELGLQFCWPHILKEGCTLDSICNDTYWGHPTTLQQHAFESSVEKGNKAAVEYFFQKLRPGEREKSLFNAAVALIRQIDFPVILHLETENTPSIFPSEQFADMFFYLLSVMDHRQRTEILQDFSFHVLYYFIEWPFKEFFFEILDLGWDFLTHENHYCLAFKMIKKCKTSVFYYNSNEYFKVFFEAFFISSPDRFRKALVNLACQRDTFFRYLWKIPTCTEIFRVIFGNVDQADRLTLVSSEYFFEGICFCIRANNCQMAEQCLKDAMLSDVEKETVKETFIRLVTRKPFFGVPEWNKFFHLLDKTTTEKRSNDIETPMTSKRLRPTFF